MTRTAMERFTAKVDRHGPIPEAYPEMTRCHLWTASRFASTGYGAFQDQGKVHRAHRWLWRAVHGEPDLGLVLDHWACGNRACVNLEHLRLVTPRENALRSETSLAATNLGKRECSAGHPFDAANTKVDARGYRSCVECGRRRARDYQRRTRAAAKVRTP